MRVFPLSNLASAMVSVGLFCVPSVSSSAGMYGSYNNRKSFLGAGLDFGSHSPTKFRSTRHSDVELVALNEVRELVLIDEAVPDKHVIYQQLQIDMDVHLIHAGQNGLDQLIAILSNYQGLDKVHLFSHAEDGALKLAGERVNQSILSEKVQTFSALNQAMRNGADLLLYGCELAKTEKGEALLELISHEANIDVAASNDRTGHPSQNGDWDLEIQKGDIDKKPTFDSIAMRDFTEILPFSGTLDLDNIPTGYSSTRSYTIPTTGYQINFTSAGSGGSDLYGYGGSGNGYVFVGTSSSSQNATIINFNSNETFNLTSLYVYNGNGSSRTIRFLSDESGSEDVTLASGVGTTVNFSGAAWTSIASVVIRYSDNSTLRQTKIDNIAIANLGPPNTTPSISIDNSTLAVTEGDAATQIDSAGTVSDADGDADWNGGTLSVQVTANSEAGDEISISDTDGDGTAITVSGTNIFSNGTDIGDLSTNGGTVTGGTVLTITFDSDATNTNVQEVLQSIRYRTTSDSPGTSNRTVTFIATDSNAASVNDTRTISMAALDNDGSLTSAGTVSEPVGISTTIDTVGEAIDVFDFTLSDDGSTDSAAMAVSQIVINVSGTTSDTIRDQITWRLNGNDASNVTGVYNASANTLTFSGLSISIANGGSEVYAVNAYFNDNIGITDNQTIILSVDGDTDVTVASSTGTGMGSTSAVNNGTGSILNVSATALAFTTQPAGSVSGSALTTQPVVTARDAFGNTDTDFTETITLTEASAGTVTNSSVAASSGVANFSGLIYTATADQQSFTLTANDQDGVGTNLSTVNANAITSDVVATQLVFDTQPVPVTVNSGVAESFSVVPVISARDGNSVVDTGYSTGITIAEVNGAGSATMTGTGDTDGSAATVTLTPSSGVSTFTGLQLTYTASGGSSENFNLQATSGGLSSANSSQLTGLVPDTDGTLTGAAGVTEPVALNYSADTVDEVVDLFDFTLTDGGTADGLPMVISDVVLNVSGTASDTDRAKVTWRLNGNDASNVTGTYNSGSDTITFSGLSISIADGGSEVYTINGYYNDNTGLAHGNTVILSVDGDTDITVASGTQMASTAAVTNSTGTVLTDDIDPVVTSVSVPANRTYALGENLDFTVNFDENITANTGSGTPRLTLIVGATTRFATYTSGTGTSALLFRYTLQSGDLDSDGIALVASLDPNVGTLRDAAGNNVNTTLNSVGSLSSVLVDAQIPSVAEVTSVSTPANDTTPNVTISSDEAGTLAVGGSCGSGNEGAIASGNTIITLTQTDNSAALAAGTYSDCTITVTDAAGNANTPVTLTSFEVDTSAPSVAEVTAVVTPGNDSTPNVTISSDEAGTLAVGGSCGSGNEGAIASGNIIITLTQTDNSTALAAGTYSDCTITVTDAAGNASTPVTLTSFEVDTSAPSVSEVTPVTTPGNDATPNVTISSDEAGTLAVGGSCGSGNEGAIASGNTTITLTQTDNSTALAAGTYSDCTITVTDAAGNVNTPVTLTSFEIDTSVPSVAEVTPVTTPGNDATPNVTISSDEAGTLAVGGSCGSGNEGAIASGNTTITLTQTDNSTALTAGTYSDCTITVTDAAGNASTPVTLTSFEIDLSAPSGQTVAFTDTTLLAADVNSAGFIFSSAEVGATFDYTISSGGGGTNVTGSGSVTNANQTVTGIDVSGLGDGTLSLSVVLTDTAGNAATAVTAQATLDTRTAQTITFTNPGNQDFGTTPTLAATASSNLGVGFASSTAGICTISTAGDLTTVSPGTCMITASQSGDATYLPATSVVQSFDVIATVSDAPLIGSAFAGNGTATVAFYAPSFDGGASISSYTVTASPGGLTSSGTEGPLTVSGLTNGVSYTFTVQATNSVGTSSSSSSSNAVIPNEDAVSLPTVIYDFEENSLDGTGNSNHATTMGGATFTSEGRTGSALRLDGSGYLILPNDVLRNQNDFTVVFWFKTGVGERGGLLGYQNMDVPNFGFATEFVPMLSVDANGLLYAELETSTGTLTASSSTRVDDDTWHKVVFAVDSTNTLIRVALDGVLVNERTASVDHQNMSYNQLGVNKGTGRTNLLDTDFFTGDLDDFAFYSTALPASAFLNNRVPTANAQTVDATEDMDQVITLTGSDPDDDSLTYTIVTNPSNGTLAGTAPNITYTPSADFNGADSFTFTVNDGIETSGAATVTLTVVAQNDTPTISGIPTTQINEDSLYGFTPSAADVDTGSALTYSIMNGPTWATFDSSDGSLTGTPTNDDVGTTNNIIISVSDGSASADLAAFNIEVINVNDAPMITGLPTRSVEEDTLYSFVPTASDADVSETLTFSVANAPSWLMIDSMSGTLMGTPTNDDVGSANNIIVSVSDGEETTSLPAFNLTVTNVNDGPVASNDTASVDEDMFVEINVLSNDSDIDDGLNNSSVVIASAPESGSTMVAATGIVTYTPAADFNGTDSFTYTVSDMAGLVSASATVMMTVNAINDAPNISGTPASNINAGIAYSFTPTASDVDTSDTLTFSVANQPSWATFNSSTGALTGTPAIADEGASSNIQISVSDGTVSENLSVFAIEVLPPVLDTDGDTITDAQEILDNTDPNDPDDYLDLLPPDLIAPDNIIVDARGLFTEVNVATLLGLASDAAVNDVASAAAALTSDNVDGEDCCMPMALNAVDGAFNLAPGVHEIMWEAEDRIGNSATVMQTLYIRPLVSMTADQLTVEGATSTVGFMLNGSAPFYPFEVPYLVSTDSTADALDHDAQSGIVTFVDGATEVSLQVNILADDIVESDETVIIQLDDRTSDVEDLMEGFDADIYDINAGAVTQTQLTIVERNVAPSLSVSVMQDGKLTAQVARDGGVLVLTAVVVDPNPGDTQSFTWSTAEDLSDTDTSDNTFTIDPSVLSIGLYTVTTSVSDSEGESDTSVTRFVVLEALPTLGSTNDADGDGVDDSSEGTIDSDGDGIPEYLDNISETNVLPQSVTQTESFLLECDPGTLCRLGEFSIIGTTGGAGVSASDLNTLPGLEDDPDYTLGNIVDFEVTNLMSAGESTRIVVPQQTAIPANAVYRKFINGQWQSFVQDANNRLQSSAGQLGFCPPPGDTAWQNGLTAGHFCVQLTIEDGGANDADGSANGVVADPGAVGLRKTVTVRSRSSGGALGWGILVLLGGLISLRHKKKGLQKKSLALVATVFFSLSLSSQELWAERSDIFVELAFIDGIASQNEVRFITDMFDSGVTIVDSDVDTKRWGFQFNAGYQQWERVALMIGYADFQEAQVNFEALSVPQDQLTDALSKSYPLSGAGFTPGLRFSDQIEDTTQVYLDIGAFIWDGEIDIRNQGITLDKSGTNAWAALGMVFDLYDKFKVGMRYQYFRLDDQSVSGLGLVASYTF